MRTMIIARNDAGQRLDKFLCKRMPSMPKGMLYKLIRKKDIRRNGARCQGSELLCEGDVITVYAREEFFLLPAQNTFLRAPGRPHLVYEDPHILVAWKPSGTLSHGGQDAPSLLDEIQKYLYDKGQYDTDAEQSFAPALCNRLDRNTEGLVIAACDAEALREMNEAIRKRHVQKRYLAVTTAPLPEREALCTAWLKKDISENRVDIRSDPPDSSWKEIRTRYAVLAQNGAQQLVLVELLTGRTHQIRAHLAYLGAPLLGDRKYGQESRSEPFQCLCAFSLRFSGMDGVLSGLEGKTLMSPLPEFVRRRFPAFQASQLPKEW